MSAITLAKLCCVCGTDCAAADRTKDTKGRYFCMRCFRELLARKQRGERIVLPAPPAPEPLEPGHDSAQPPHVVDGARGPDLASDRSGSHGTLEALSLSADSPLLATELGTMPECAMLPAPLCVACPSCAALLAPSATICLQCGTNVRTGRRLATRWVGPRKSLWPAVLGSVALLVALALLALSGIQAYGVLTLPMDAGQRVGQGVAALIQAWLALWHGAGALDTLRRRELGVHRLRLSSAVWLALLAAATAAGVSLATMFMARSPARQALLDSMILGALCSAAWPLIVVAWTSRRAVQRDVAAWR